MTSQDTDRAAKGALPAKPEPQPGRAGWRVVAACAVRRNWPAVVLLTAGLALRIMAVLAYRPALFYIDTPRYLLGEAFGMDPLGYGGVLRAILAIGNFDLVVVIQHLLGMAMAVVIYVLLLRRGAGRWFAALAIAPLLLDAYQVQIEQVLMPDVWLEAVIVAGLAILLWQPDAGWRRIVLAGFVLGTSATVAQVGEALLLPAIIYVLALGSGWRRAIGNAGALCVAFAVPILAYMTGSYAITGNFFLSHTGDTSLYGRLAAAADCATLRLPAAERAMCPSPTQQARGPDWLEYDPGSPIRPYYDNQPRPRTDAQITDFNHRILRQQPLRVLAAYGTDVAKLFTVNHTTGAGDTPVYRWQFQSRYPYFPPWTSTGKIDRVIAKYGGGKPAVWHPVAGFLRAYQLGGGYTPGALYALLTAGGLIGSALLLRRRQSGGPEASSRGEAPDTGTRQLALACLLFTASGTFVVLVSDFFQFSWRYQLPALVTLVPGGALGFAAAVRQYRGRRAVQPRV
ncbi:MAG: hypothetical protein ACTHJW_18495 [Streptosporangiaceae bacterium]